MISPKDFITKISPDCINIASYMYYIGIQGYKCADIVGSIYLYYRMGLPILNCGDNVDAEITEETRKWFFNLSLEELKSLLVLLALEK